jgi:beta-lactamase superfamily II metal-dependent hydrolase
MIFTLEILQAFHGDSLLLYYGTKEKPRVIVIDGGPSGTYEGFLRPRLKQLKDSLSPSEPLPLSMVMVSHLDDDHISGILSLTNEAIIHEDFRIKNLWFNTFDDIIGNTEIPFFSSMPATALASNISAILAMPSVPKHIMAVLASIGQGKELKKDARALNATVNNPFTPLEEGQNPLVRGDIGESVIQWKDDLSITVLHPNKKRLLKLQEKWDEAIKKAKADGNNASLFATATSKDTSPFNLSSIVCLLKFGGKTMLVTGDARADDILEGLEINNLLDAEGKIHVDILKIPHHGSSRNLTIDFFRKVTADHYVISANGKFKNPDEEALEMFAEGTKGRDNFTLHLTNKEGKDKDFDLKPMLNKFIKKEKNSGRTYKVNFRKASSNSIVLNLLEKIQF